MKRCYICGVEKSESEFYKDSSRPDGLEYRCKPCSNEVRVKRMKRTSPILNAHRYNCKKCGESRLYLIDFHHIKPSDKRFNISDGKHSPIEIEEEINKCICLCKNCHCEFHYLYGKTPENPELALAEYLGK